MQEFLPDLTSLDLSNNNFSDALAPELFETIMKFKNLKTLDLSSMNFGEEAIEILSSKFLPNANQLTTLDLSSNRIQKPPIANSLARGLLGCKSLRHLIMRRMKLNNATLRLIGKGFSYKLLSLKLDHNKITDDCMKILADQIRKGEGDVENKITYDDSYNNPGCQMWALRKLSLSKNELTDQSVKYVRSIA